MFRTMIMVVTLFAGTIIPAFSQSAKLATRFDFAEGAKPCTSYGVINPHIEGWVYNLGSKNPNAEVGSFRSIVIPGGRVQLGGYVSSYFQKGQLYAVPSVIWNMRLAKGWNTYGNIGGYAPVTHDKWFVFLKEVNITRQLGEFRIGVAATFTAKEGAPFPILWGGKLEWKNLQFRALLPHGKDPTLIRLFSVTSF